MTAKDHRHRWIRRLLEQERIASQDQLRKRLAAHGVRAQQATLSRDLHEIGVVKAPDGYALPETMISTPPADLNGLARTAGQYLLGVERGGNLVVIRTGPGRAQPFALEVDNARLEGVMGTIAGDDTIFIAAKSERDAGRLTKFFSNLGGLLT